MKWLLILSAFSFTFFLNSHAQTPSQKVRAAIIGTMQNQTEAWNQGDLEGFMDGYWKNDSLTFIGKSGLTYGWEPTLKRYKEGYPDKATMGKLIFSAIKMRKLSGKLVFVTGKWFLERQGDKEDLEGWYSLLWKKERGKWVIMADHSS